MPSGGSNSVGLQYAVKKLYNLLYQSHSWVRKATAPLSYHVPAPRADS